MPFIGIAAVDTLRKFPIVNASMEGSSIRYHEDINLGIAVALEWGLIVPVVKQAEERSFLGMARAIADLAERARAKRLEPDEASGSTFTLTNSGIFGEEFGTPIINQPGGGHPRHWQPEEGTSRLLPTPRATTPLRSARAALLPRLRPPHH